VRSAKRRTPPPRSTSDESDHNGNIVFLLLNETRNYCNWDV